MYDRYVTQTIHQCETVVLLAYCSSVAFVKPHETSFIHPLIRVLLQVTLNGRQSVSLVMNSFNCMTFDMFPCSSIMYVPV